MYTRHLICNSHSYTIFTFVRPAGPSASNKFLLDKHFERDAIKKVHSANPLVPPFFSPLHLPPPPISHCCHRRRYRCSRALLSVGTHARDAQSGHSVCELLTTRSCIRCTRCIHTHRRAPGHPVVHTTSTSIRSFPS